MRKVLRALFPRGQDGFSYNEVLVSMVFIAVGVLGFSLNTIGVMKGNRRSADYTVATHLAEDKMEQLIGRPPIINLDNCLAYGERGLSAAGLPGGIYDRCWSIKSSPLGSGLKEVRVIVNWRDNEARSVTLLTLIFTE